MSGEELDAHEEELQTPEEYYPEYDGPSAPPVFVVLESDLQSHELRSSKINIGKKISDPLKRGIQLQKKGSMLSRSSKVKPL